MSKEKKAEKPKCPKCGETHLQMWEDVISSRDVHDINENGALEISGHCSPGDDGENARFFCVSCSHTFPIPEGLEVEYV